MGVGYAVVASVTAGHQVFLVSVGDVEDITAALSSQFVAVAVVCLRVKAVVATASKNRKC